MNPLLQATILGMYRLVLRTGILETTSGYAAFERCYDWYKVWLEAASLRHIRPFVPEGSTVVDVGAHVGFFTETFAGWVGERGRVIALEPEPINYGRLHNRLERTGLRSRVTSFNVAAVEASGDYLLHINPDHPGDHRLDGTGVPVRGLTLDEVLQGCGSPDVSLVKLDVQGAEARVLAGAEKTLARCRPALIVEIEDERLRQQGSSAEALLALLAARGYAPQHLSRSGISRVLAIPDALDKAGRNGQYSDFLFVGRWNPSASTVGSGSVDGVF